MNSQMWFPKEIGGGGGRMKESHDGDRRKKATRGIVGE